VTEVVWERARTFERAWIVGWWAAGRALVLVATALVGAFGPRGYAGPDERSHVLGLLAAWDGRWYRTVAENGYLLEPGRQSDPAFFPLFPLLMRGLHVIGLGYVTAGIVISNLTFLVALFLFEALTRELLGAATARRATALLAVFPLAFVFSLGYPESLVLTLMMGAALAAYRGRWSITAAALAAATLTRPETLFLSLPLLPLAWRARSGVALGAILAPFAALGSFAFYLWRTLGDPLAWTHAERAWGRQFQALGLVHAIENVPRQFAGNAGIVRDIACFALYLVLLVVAYRRGVPRLWVLAGALVVVLPTFSGSFHSIGRFGLLAPAVVWGAALCVRRPAVYLVSAALMVAGVVTLPLVFP
jgi:mannosyltransferase PIG-V